MYGAVLDMQLMGGTTDAASSAGFIRILRERGCLPLGHPKLFGTALEQCITASMNM